MAGRGRGRGKGISFNVEALGFGRGETLPVSVLQPPPLFPMRLTKPVPLQQGDDADYMLALKQEFRETIQKSPYFIKSHLKKTDIMRYSDKYQKLQENISEWKPDWSRFPEELQCKKRKKTKSAAKPDLSKARRSTDSIEIPVEVFFTSTEVGDEPDKEKADNEEEGDTEEKSEEKAKEGEEPEVEEEFEDSEAEEETDYISTYFDNGEDYGDDDEEDDGPVY